MSKLDRQVTRFAEALASLGVIGLLLIAMFTVADITGRYVFGKPLIGYVDVAGLATALVVSTFFPLLLLRRGNITLQLLGKLGGHWGHVLLESFAALVSLGFFALMAWQYFGFAAEAVAAGERMPVMRWPTGPWWWGVTLFISLAALAALFVLAEELRAFGKKRP